MKGYLNQGTFAGILTLIARKGQVAHLEAFGWQDLENKRPMKVDTIFRIYSMSKPVTSTAVMMLCEEGDCDCGPGFALSAGVQKCRVMVARPDGSYDLVPARREVTIHDLLTTRAASVTVPMSTPPWISSIAKPFSAWIKSSTRWKNG